MPRAGKDLRNIEANALWETFEMMQLLWKQFDSFLIKLPYDTTFSLIGLYPKGKRANVPTKNSENVYSSIVCNC